MALASKLKSARSLLLLEGVAALACLIGLSQGCERPPPEPTVGSVGACVPGLVAACPCPGGMVGVQACDDDGARYGPCEQCAPVAVSAPSAAATSQPGGYDEDADLAEGGFDDDDDDDDAWSSSTSSPTSYPSARPVAGPRLAPLPTGVPLTRFAPGTDCASTRPCQWGGQCTSTYGGCARTSDADCRKSERCRSHGRCSFRRGGGFPGYCDVGSDADCRQSELCAELGKCSAKDRSCIATRSADCRKTVHCRQRGLCSAKEGACVAGRDADCKGADACKVGGFCRASNGFCVR